MNNNALPYRPQANYAQNAPAVIAPSLPQKVNLDEVDPSYRDIYQEYNNNLDYLNTRLQNAQQTATASSRNVDEAYKTNVTGAENTYTTRLNTAQQANQDAQLANRLRARAIGGAPSSGFLDLANRTDIQTQRDVGQAGRELQTAYQKAQQLASQALTNINTALNDAIAQIQGDASLSLRQKNDAIQQARIRAASVAQGINWEDFMNAFSAEEENVQDMMSTSFVPGAIGSRSGGGLLYGQPGVSGAVQGVSTQRVQSPTQLQYGGSSPVRSSQPVQLYNNRIFS